MVKVPKGYRSKDVQDRRGGGGGGGFGGGGLGFPGRRRGGGSGGGINLPGGGDLGGTMGGGRTGGSRMPSRRAGCGGGGMVVMLIVVALLFVMCSGGTNFGSDVLSDGPAPQRTPAPDAPAVTEAEDLVNFVLDDVQQFWTEVYADAGETYPRAQLVLFDNSVDTGGCGRATSQVGPFYCPADSNAYIDLQFMLLLQSRLGAEGDFAQAYILAHEIGHHVQNVEGINKAVREAQANRSRADANRLSVAMELQADCLAGMWARSAQQAGLLEQGDIEEGVRAADAVGDDAITGSSNQENFTHGTSAERVRWFRTGMETGDFNECTRTFEGL